MIIAGSRSFNDYKLLRRECLIILDDLKKAGFSTKRKTLEIISGTAKGADQLGERFAKEFDLKLKKMPANWDKYGKAAGYIRNKAMADYAALDDVNVLIAFWDMHSSGTKNMIDIANDKSMLVYIIQTELVNQ